MSSQNFWNSEQTPFESKKLQRKFTQTNLISKHLVCIICQDTFDSPTRLGCGHTFCESCIQEWQKSNINCPICRKKIIKSHISTDLVAANIINDLEVVCVNDHCPWKGVLSELERHVKNCLFDKQKLSEEIKVILNKESSAKSSFDIENHGNDYLAFNSQSSLKARLYEKNPEIMVNSLVKRDNSGKEILFFDLIEKVESEKNKNEIIDIRKNIPYSADSDEENVKEVSLINSEEKAKNNSFQQTRQNNNFNQISSENLEETQKQIENLSQEVKNKWRKKAGRNKKEILLNLNEVVVLEEGEALNELSEDALIEIALKRSVKNDVTN